MNRIFDTYSLKQKIQTIANVYDIPIEFVQNEYNFLSSQQMTENRKWEYIISQIYKQKGVI